MKDRTTKAALAERYRQVWKLYRGVGQWMVDQRVQGGEWDRSSRKWIN